MDKNIETKVAKAILQEPFAVHIGSKTYRVAPPSVATLILVSEVISKVKTEKIDYDNILNESLRIAKDSKWICEIISIMILGAKKVNKRHWLTMRKQKNVLTRELLTNKEPKELRMLMTELLSRMQIGDFFGLTTSLIEINLLRQTKEVVNQTIVSGQ